MRRLRGINLSIVILSLVLISILGFGYLQVNNGKIAKNTYIKNVNVGNLNEKEAKEKIKNECKADIITFTYKDKKWNINPDDIDTKYDIDRTVKDALKVNRNKNILFNSINMIKSNFGIENNVNVSVYCNKDKVKEKLKEISKEVNVSMKNATLDICDGNIKINEEISGIELNLNATIINLEKSLQNGINKENLVVTKVEPEIRKDDLKNINTLLGSYKTTLSDVSHNRVENIKIATKRTSGVLLMPNQEFSYNSYTGMRTKENGYKNATLISEGEVTQGLGGGICQVSTTLYNAVLYAGLDIVKVSNNTIPSSYVPKGRDAVVSDSGLDFIFKNNYNEPVYIKNYYKNSEVTCQVYGNINDKKHVEILTSIDKVGEKIIKKEKDSTLEKGKKKVIEYGRNSYTVSTYRVSYDKNGKEIKREKISTSYYPAKEKIVLVGTKEKVIKSDKEDNLSKKNNKNEDNEKQEEIIKNEYEIDDDETYENETNEEEIISID